MDGISPATLYGDAVSRRLLRWAGVGVVLAIGAAFVLGLWGPPRFRPWNCHDGVERSTVDAAIDAYYESCWDHPDRLAAFDGNDGVTPYQDWYDVDEYSAYYDGGKIRFLLVGRKNATAPWVAIGEGTGP